MTTEDRLNVAETVYRYAYGVDTRDFALYRSIFAERVAIDFTSYHGGEAMVMTADQWVAGVRPLFTALAATQHSMTNPVTSIDGDGLPHVCAGSSRLPRRRSCVVVHDRRLLRRHARAFRRRSGRLAAHRCHAHRAVAPR